MPKFQSRTNGVIHLCQCRFSIRRKPTEDPGCRTGEILEPNTIFKVKKVIKREVGHTH